MLTALALTAVATAAYLVWLGTRVKCVERREP